MKLDRGRNALPVGKSEILAFIGQRESIKPDWFEALPFPVDSEWGSAFLLYAAALKGIIPEPQTGQFLSALWEAYGLQLFRLSHRPYEELFDFVAGGKWGDDPQRSKIAGILRSVSDFFFKQGTVSQYILKGISGEAMVDDLAAQIFWMGKTSTYKNKARFFLWLAYQAGLAPVSLLESAAAPLTRGHMQWIAAFGDRGFKERFFQATPPAKLAMVSKWLREILPLGDWKAFLAMDEFLNRQGPNSFLCRFARKSCDRCPLQKVCPGAALDPGKGLPP